MSNKSQVRKDQDNVFKNIILPGIAGILSNIVIANPETHGLDDVVKSLGGFAMAGMLNGTPAGIHGMALGALTGLAFGAIKTRILGGAIIATQIKKKEK